MAADVVSASTEFDIFATRPVQSLTFETIETASKPIASLDQRDLEYPIPADHDKHIDLNTQLYIRGKLTQADEADLELNGVTCVAYNLLRTLLEQCNISINGVTITHSAALYYYPVYLLERQLAERCQTFPLRNLDHYEVCTVYGSVVVVAPRGTYVRPISYFTRNAYSSPYWPFFRFQRHLTLVFSTCLQRYIHEERLSAT